MPTPEWMKKAEQKDLPPKFVERLEASESVTEEEKQKIIESVQLARDIEPPDEPPHDLTDESIGDLSLAEEQAIRDRFGYSSSETRTKAERDAAAANMLAYAKKQFGLEAAPMVTEEDYVANEVEITRRQMQAGQLKEVIVDGVGRLERCEAYARWRYKGFMAGEVASL